jgi:cytidine deaminase
MRKSLLDRIWSPSGKFIEQEVDWIQGEIQRIGASKLRALAKKAASQRRLSYCPYSKYKVGAAVLTASGKVYVGSNVERATYSETHHGEEAAVTAAVLDGEVERSGRKFIKALAVSHAEDTAPCGRCRQVMVEHCDNALVIVANTRGKIRRITSVKLLLPYAFAPSDLGME